MAANPGTPYVGMRPFEPGEKAIFTGRDRDAAILTDKILAARQTVLYAESGLGKSSLLRVLVIPALEQNDASAVYFDHWSHADPLAALTAALAARAAGLGIPDAGLGHPSLSEVVRLISVATGQAVVLVLDQFEECLRRPDYDVTPLRQELAKIVHTPSIDAAVVLSLREEFLASLEDFRRAIPDLFASVYRLEALTREQLVTAICDPPLVCGSACEAALATRLIDDVEQLARGHGGHGADVPSERRPANDRVAGHALPIVQLVCSELWRAAQGATLDVGLYQRHGGTAQIVKSYVHRVMPTGIRTSVFTARLMRFLAPPSGKIPYSAGDLASMTGLNEMKVATELDRLKAAGILQTRPFQKVTRYELQHDAYVGVIGPWRDRVISRRQSRKRVLVGLAAGLVIAVVGMTVVLMDSRARLSVAEVQRELHEHEDRSRADRAQADRERQENERKAAQSIAMKDWAEGGFMDDGAPRDAREVLAARFGFLVASHLWPKRGPARLDELKEKLKEFEAVLPSGYANRTDIPPIDPDDRSPVVIEYGPDLQIDGKAFASEWSELAIGVTRTWRVPVPRHVRLEAASDVPPGELRVTFEGARPLRVRVPDYHGMALLLEKPQSPEAHQFYLRFVTEWRDDDARKDWHRVPQWSFPVWKLSNTMMTSASGAMARHAVERLIAQPDAMLSAASLDALLEPLLADYRTTVNEARRARGDKLATDLASLMRSGPRLAALPAVLDILAEMPNVDSTTAAARVDEELFDGDWSSLRLRSRGWLGGPFTIKPRDVTSCVSTTVGEESVVKPYCEAARDLPRPDRPLRAYISDDLMQVWWPNGAASPELASGLRSLREGFYARYGVQLSTVVFRSEPLGRATVRVEVLGEHPDPDRARPLKLSGPADLAPFFDLLEEKVNWVAPFWVTADTIQRELGELPVSLRDELMLRYSITDLKIMLRELIASGTAGGARYPQWLLQSILFWSVAANDGQQREVAQLRAFLSTLQSKRRTPTGEVVQTDVVAGAEALAIDDIGEAARRFAAATKANPQAAIRDFLIEWPRHAADVWTRDFEAAHRTLANVTLTTNERADIEELLSHPEGLTPGARSKLTLYRQAGEDLASPEAVKMLRQAAALFATAPSLPAAYERWLGEQILEHYDPARDPVPVLQAGSALVRSAVRRLPAADARQTLLDILRIARGDGPHAWAWTLAENLVTDRTATIEASLGIELAWSLCHQESPDLLKRALTHAANFETLVRASSLPADRKQAYAETTQYIRAVSLFRLARAGEARWDEPAALLGLLLDSRDESLKRNARFYAIALEQEQGRVAEADRDLAAARRTWPDVIDFHESELWWQLRQLRRTTATTLVSTARERARAAAASDRPSWWLMTAVAAPVLGIDGWESDMQAFLGERHAYRDLVLMLYGGFATGHRAAAAQKAIEARWQEVRKTKDSWRARLALGDAMAWREVLLGRFAGDTLAIEILRPLDDPTAFAGSELAKLPATRAGLRTESAFYDAMRAKMAGNQDDYRARLAEVIGLDYESYIEFSLAVFLSAPTS